MTNLLSMRGELHHHSYPVNQSGGISMGVSDQVSKEGVDRLIKDFRTVQSEWPEDALVKDILLEIRYDTIVSKTNRVRGLIKENRRDSLHGVVGARYEHTEEHDPYHVLTYYITRRNVEEAIEKLETISDYLDGFFSEDGYVDRTGFERIGKDIQPPQGWSPTATKQIIHDCIHAVSVSVPFYEGRIAKRSIVGIFPTELKATDLLPWQNRLEQRDALIDETTLLLDINQFDDLVAQAPYLVTMAVDDSYDVDEYKESDGAWEDPLPFVVQEPNDEPTVGVIDTLFDMSSQLSPWVENHPMLGDEIHPTLKDYEHGTEVTSIIVAGHELNPDLDDGCGWFRVRHFGVARTWGNSMSRLMRNIVQIVENNPDIRVWNLSLGQDQEISQNVISPLAACLDRLQNEKDVLFVVAGTNDDARTRSLRLGSPGDSINSIVVNAVRRDGTPASYSRRGPVLSFFTKPDVSYYGGDDKEAIKTLSGIGVVSEKGTSLAAPWVARKAAYLIEVLHLPRDVAKALLVDAAIPWTTAAVEAGVSAEKGYGIIPQRIEDVIRAKGDEIKFYISGRTENYETYTEGIPVPLDRKMFPYSARAVLSYAPACEKRQGVDYTNTELTLSFGRHKDKVHQDGTPYTGIENIKDRFTLAPDEFTPYEKATRKYKRKWDNVKVKIEKSEGAKPKKMFQERDEWGISITKTERLNDGSGNDLPFGLVVTLKAVDGKSRIEDFIQQCTRRRWTVREVKPEVKQRLSQQSQKRIEFK